MVKKINKNSVAIKTLLNKRLKPIEVAQILDISKQKVNYWRKNEIKSTQLAEQNRICHLSKKFVNSHEIKQRVR